MIVVDVILLVLAGLLAVPTLVLTLEVLAAIPASRHVRGILARGELHADRPSVAVVVPAHNEEGLLAATLASLVRQLDLGGRDRLLVVADNCGDATADFARAAGVEVLERHDPERRGKGWALDAGMRRLAETGEVPDVVIFNDADVLAADGAIGALARQVAATGRPAQSSYLMAAPATARRRDLISRFALATKNHIRPIGLWQFGLPCPLFGSGMAFPAKLAQTMPLASGDLVEDMRLGIHLCGQGHPPLFCPAARFDGDLPSNDADAATQRRRWEHGHLSVLLATPGLFWRGLTRLDVRMMVAALDHAVQPLTVLCGSLAAVAAVTSLRLLLPDDAGAVALAAVAVAAGGLATLAGSLGIAWLIYLRYEMPLTTMLGLPSYVLRRVPNQAAFLFRRQQAWVRTPRDGERRGAAVADGGR